MRNNTPRVTVPEPSFEDMESLKKRIQNLELEIAKMKSALYKKRISKVKKVE